MRNLILVNASPILKDSEVEACVKPLQKQIDRDFYPAWFERVDKHRVSFASASEIPNLEDSPDTRPIFMNRHSVDDDALGWHDFDTTSFKRRAYSRVFVGDSMQLGLDWRTTLSHEALELILDPDVRRVWRMPDGRYAALEACDAVEADDQAYDIDGFPASNFVLPRYFSQNKKGPWDFRAKLSGPCPTLTPGGYMSITDSHGNWSQVTMDRRNGLAGRRAVMKGARRQARSRLLFDQLLPVG